MIKINRCKYRSAIDIFKIKTYIGKHRIHHGYVGGILMAISLFSMHLGQDSHIIVGIGIGSCIVLIDDILAHTRNKIRGVED